MSCVFPSLVVLTSSLAMYSSRIQFTSLHSVTSLFDHPLHLRLCTTLAQVAGAPLPLVLTVIHLRWCLVDIKNLNGPSWTNGARPLQAWFWNLVPLRSVPHNSNATLGNHTWQRIQQWLSYHLVTDLSVTIARKVGPGLQDLQKRGRRILAERNAEKAEENTWIGWMVVAESIGELDGLIKSRAI